MNLDQQRERDLEIERRIARLLVLGPMNVATIAVAVATTRTRTRSILERMLGRGRVRVRRSSRSDPDAPTSVQLWSLAR